MSWYFEALKKYAEFSGRARRKEYWMFWFCSAIIIAALLVVDVLAGTAVVITGIYSLAVCIPSIAVTVRRLHDTNRSGWWYFISFVPLVGGIVLLVFTVQDSHPNDNQYGANPKASES